MAQKRFGPTLDAGVVMIERESQKTISDSMLGCTAYVGVLERGPTNELISCSGRRDMLAKTGGYIPESMVPDVANDFWSLGEGAGVLFLCRVTDGNEVKATLDLYDRGSLTTKQKVITMTAKNGGGWGGKLQTWVCDLAAVPASILTETTVELPVAFVCHADQFKGGYITFSDTGESYLIISNTAGPGSVTPAVITVSAESLMITDFGAGVDLEVTLELASKDNYGQAKHLAALVKDGQENPTSEFGLEFYCNDELVLSYPDLSMDPNNAHYFLDLINNDGKNHYVTVADALTPKVPTATNRPANFFGTVLKAALTSTVATLTTVIVLVDESNIAGTMTVDTFTFGSKVIADTYKLTLTVPGPTWALTSQRYQATHAFTAPLDTVAYAADNDYSIGFIATAGTGTTGKYFTITVIPLVEDMAIGGRIHLADAASVYVTKAWKNGYLITDNTESGVTISTGDLTLVADGGTLPANVPIRLEYRQQFQGGYDGIAAIDTAHFTKYYDLGGTSPFEQLRNKGYGLVKFATPGISDFDAVVSSFSDSKTILVEKAGAAWADSRNYQYRYEILPTTVDEFEAKARVLDTYGKNTFTKVIFPSWVYVSDPVRLGRLKLIPATGMVHGLEAKSAYNYNGYHKVAAGIDMVMPRIVKLPTGDVILNGELLNPAGLQRIEKRGGNFVIWGGRIPTADPAYKFCQHRELMSHYEHVLQEAFDYIIFAINDKQEWPMLRAAFKSYFLPEWRKRALRGDTFAEACTIKIDAEINTSATMAAGDMYAEIGLTLADTVERLNIIVGKNGIFDEVA